MAILGKTNLPGVGGGSPGINGYANYNKAKDTAKTIANKTNLNVHNNIVKAHDDYVASQTPSYSGGGGGGGYSLPVIEQPDYSAWFNTLTDIYNKLYDTQKNAIEASRQRLDNKADMNWARNMREWRKMYANENNGQGLSNRLNINYNRDNQKEENQATADTNLLNALSGRYTNLAGLTSQLPNMDNNTIKKIMSHVGSISI